MELKDIPHKISYRDIKYPRLEFRSGELHLILPQNARLDELFQKHKKWIQNKLEFIEECLKKSEKKELIQRSEDEFKGLVLTLIMKVSDDLKARINNVYFKSMKTKWASFSAKKNLMVNKLARYLPEYLIKYMVFHEIAHLKQKRHNDQFWMTISKKFKNYTELETELFIYWFRLASQQ